MKSSACGSLSSICRALTGNRLCLSTPPRPTICHPRFCASCIRLIPVSSGNPPTLEVGEQSFGYGNKDTYTCNDGIVTSTPITTNGVTRSGDISQLYGSCDCWYEEQQLGTPGYVSYGATAIGSTPATNNPLNWIATNGELSIAAPAPEAPSVLRRPCGTLAAAVSNALEGRYIGFVFKGGILSFGFPDVTNEGVVSSVLALFEHTL